MNKVEDFYNRLEVLRKPKPDDPYDNRVTHCLLRYKDSKGKTHRIEVRGWSSLDNNKLNVSIVSWTLCAGTANLHIDSENVDKFVIVEDK